MQSTDAASKKQMLAYLLAGILCMLGKMHGWLKGWWGDRAAKSGDWTSKERMRYLKQIWIAYHALGMTAMLQLCYHKGASKAGSRYMSLSLQRIAGKQSTHASASKVRMLRQAKNLCGIRHP
jgi:hypothetical protein